ncbi:hypothetical protein [Phnomibacter ginsenosidimutans]|uniref:Uncharacterized protein n=1 Tax=Phnomibacter ginsenosidimutans TaxID=2676868 RepID=A0A6I6G6F1_9BACT|nr:hypothetical protein [Phnomibacter ginsenosidimutans]QGW27857.1 hypothetical protein GLV81_06885 [Phnomibacter ginsenosidimutans]
MMERKQFLLNMVKLMPAMALAPSVVFARDNEAALKCEQVLLGKAQPVVLQAKGKTQHIQQAVSVSYRNNMFWITDIWGKQYSTSNLLIHADEFEISPALNEVMLNVAGVKTSLHLETSKKANHPQLRCFSAAKLTTDMMQRWMATPKPTLVAIS